MTRAKLLSIALLTALILSSCSSKKNNVPEQIDISVNDHTYQAAIPDEQSAESDPNLFPDHLSDIENEYITADAEIMMPAEYSKDTVLNTYHSVYMEWDDEKIINEFMTNGLIPATSVTEKKIYDSREKIAGTDRVKYVLDDGSDIVFQSGEITYTTPESRSASFEKNIDKYLVEENKADPAGNDDQNVTDALNESKGLLETAGVYGKVTDPEVYLLNSEDTDAADEDTEDDVNESINENNTYIIVYPVVTSGLPSSGVISRQEDEVLDCSMVYFIYSQGQLAEFKINGMIKSSAVAEEAQILSPVHAFNLLRRSYDADNKCSITSIRLVSINRIVYKSDSVQIVTEPVWMFTGKYADARYSDQSMITYVSAVSGEVIPVNQITD